MSNTNRARGTTTERGYGAKHKQERARLKPAVERGEADCAEIVCLVEQETGSRWIEPGTAWDLAHDRVTGDYLGPAHQLCNRSEGGRYLTSGSDMINTGWHSDAW